MSTDRFDGTEQRPETSVTRTDGRATVEGLERSIVAIWSQVLKLEPQAVGVHTSFFDLGGHSLLLAQVHKHLEKTLGRDLQVSLLFRYPTIRGLATHLEGGNETTTKADERARTRQQMAGRRRRGQSDRGRRDL